MYTEHYYAMPVNYVWRSVHIRKMLIRQIVYLVDFSMIWILLIAFLRYSIAQTPEKA